LIETTDFLLVSDDAGWPRRKPRANKGMALFPAQKSTGRYAMIRATRDNENLLSGSISDDLWAGGEGGQAILKPQFPLGSSCRSVNCGSTGRTGGEVG